MKNLMQISYWTLGGFANQTPVEEVLTQAKDMGYDGVELAFEAEGVLCPSTTEKTCVQYRQCAERLNLRLATLASGFYWNTSLSSPQDEVREKSLEFTQAYLRAAHWLGAETILVIPGVVAVPWESPQPCADYKTIWEKATNSLWKLASAAEKYRVAIGLENVWNWFLTDPMAMKLFIDQFASPWIGSYFDVANCLINGYPEHWINILDYRLKAVHVKNFTRNGEGGGGLSGFGDDLLQGSANWPEIMAALRNCGYSGPLTAEMIPFSRLPELNLPDQPLARTTADKLRLIMDKSN